MKLKIKRFRILGSRDYTLGSENAFANCEQTAKRKSLLDGYSRKSTGSWNCAAENSYLGLEKFR